MSIQAEFSFTDGSPSFTVTGDSYREVLSELVDHLPAADKGLIAIPPAPASGRGRSRGRGAVRGSRAVASATGTRASARAAAAATSARGRGAATRGSRGRGRGAAPTAATPAAFTPHVHRPSNPYASRGPETGVPGNPWNDPRRGPPGCPHLSRRVN